MSNDRDLYDMVSRLMEEEIDKSMAALSRDLWGYGIQDMTDENGNKPMRVVFLTEEYESDAGPVTELVASVESNPDFKWNFKGLAMMTDDQEDAQ